jgi:hypothetical protein
MNLVSSIAGRKLPVREYKETNAPCPMFALFSGANVGYHNRQHSGVNGGVHISGVGQKFFCALCRLIPSNGAQWNHD